MKRCVVYEQGCRGGDKEGTRRGKLPRGLGGLLKQGIHILEMNFNETQQSMPKISKLGKRLKKKF